MRQSRACFARTGHLIRYMTRKAESSILIGCKGWRVKRVSLLGGAGWWWPLSLCIEGPNKQGVFSVNAEYSNTAN